MEQDADSPNNATRQAKRLDLYEEHAKEKHNLPDNWRIYKWECFPKSGHEPTIFIAVTGAVCDGKFVKGKRKGHTDWSKRDLATEVTSNISVSDHDKWKSDWERRTRLCHECTGTGEVFSGWSVAEGTRYRTCRRCKGSGDASNLETVEATTASPLTQKI